MLDFEISQRLARLQERLRTSTFHELRKDGVYKMSEGAISLSFCLPPVVGDREAPHWRVSVYSYVLGPERDHVFHGASALEAISKAEDAVKLWCAGPEMEMFEADFARGDADDESEGAKHWSDCSSWNTPPEPCDCGWPEEAK